MTIPRGTSRQLDETLARLNREHLLVIDLDALHARIAWRSARAEPRRRAGL